MLRLSNWKTNDLDNIKVYIFGVYELSNDMSHYAESVLCQKLLILDSFLGKHSIRNISEIRNATKQIKYFFGPTLYEQLLGINH